MNVSEELQKQSLNYVEYFFNSELNEQKFYNWLHILLNRIKICKNFNFNDMDISDKKLYHNALLQLVCIAFITKSKKMTSEVGEYIHKKLNGDLVNLFIELQCEYNETVDACNNSIEKDISHLSNYTKLNGELMFDDMSKDKLIQFQEKMGIVSNNKSLKDIIYRITRQSVLGSICYIIDFLTFLNETIEHNANPVIHPYHIIDLKVGNNFWYHNFTISNTLLTYTTISFITFKINKNDPMNDTSTTGMAGIILITYKIDINNPSNNSIDIILCRVLNTNNTPILINSNNDGFLPFNTQMYFKKPLIDFIKQSSDKIIELDAINDYIKYMNRFLFIDPRLAAALAVFAVNGATGPQVDVKGEEKAEEEAEEESEEESEELSLDQNQDQDRIKAQIAELQKQIEAKTEQMSATANESNAADIEQEINVLQEKQTQLESQLNTSDRNAASAERVRVAKEKKQKNNENAATLKAKQNENKRINHEKKQAILRSAKEAKSEYEKNSTHLFNNISNKIATANIDIIAYTELKKSDTQTKESIPRIKEYTAKINTAIQNINKDIVGIEQLISSYKTTVYAIYGKNSTTADSIYQLNNNDNTITNKTAIDKFIQEQQNKLTEYKNKLQQITESFNSLSSIPNSATLESTTLDPAATFGDAVTIEPAARLEPTTTTSGRPTASAESPYATAPGRTKPKIDLNYLKNFNGLINSLTTMKNQSKPINNLTLQELKNQYNELKTKLKLNKIKRDKNKKNLKLEAQFTFANKAIKTLESRIASSPPS